jgi:hypothetical protein
VNRFKRWRLPAITAVVAAGLMVPASAGAFGTINGMGQHAEHEKITKVLACGADDPVASCFQDGSMAMLAGSDGTIGGVGLPDRVTEIEGHPDNHCDQGDYLPGAPYQRSDAERALTAIDDCVTLFGRHVEEAVDAAGGLAAGGKINFKQADATEPCPWDLSRSVGFEVGTPSAKCKVVDGFGRALHAAEDFWSHTNWADQANPDEPTILPGTGDDAAPTYNILNPPGLGHSELVPYLRFPVPRDTLPTMEEELAGEAPISGCDDSIDEVKNKGIKWLDTVRHTGLSQVDSCPERVKHSTLNKDKGLIEWRSGKTSDPETSRGRIGDNFQRAVTGARKQVRAIWGDFVDAVDQRYGDARGGLILQALTTDTPWTTCKLSGKSPFVEDLPGGEQSRALRSVNAVFRNETGQPLTCGEAVLDSGVWASLPANSVAVGATMKFRTESNVATIDSKRLKIASGGPEGAVTYAIGATGYSVAIRWDNPLVGSNSYGCVFLRGGVPVKDAPYSCSRSGGSGNDSNPTFTVVAR